MQQKNTLPDQVLEEIYITSTSKKDEDSSDDRSSIHVDKKAEKKAGKKQLPQAAILCKEKITQKFICFPVSPRWRGQKRGCLSANFRI